MINKFALGNLRNAEHIQYMASAHLIFAKYNVDAEHLGAYYAELGDLVKTAEASLAFEKKNEKIREKNDADRLRDRLHSRLFNYLKYILYDDRDPRYDDAQAVMKTVKDAGNPTQLAENAESALLNALGSRLETCRAQVESAGAQHIVDELMEANRKFIALEIECRDIIASMKLAAPPAVSAVRKQIDPVYRLIVDAINGYARIPAKNTEYYELITDMNVLVEKYDALLSQRKKGNTEVNNQQK
jgi:hypothetical protein